MQELLRRVEVRPAADLTARFPAEHACRLRLHLAGGVTLAAEKSDYQGFVTRPMSWERARQKFQRLAAETIERQLAAELAEAVSALEELETQDLTAMLARIGSGADDRRSSPMTNIDEQN